MMANVLFLECIVIAGVYLHMQKNARWQFFPFFIMAFAFLQYANFLIVLCEKKTSVIGDNMVILVLEN